MAGEPTWIYKGQAQKYNSEIGKIHTTKGGIAIRCATSKLPFSRSFLPRLTSAKLIDVSRPEPGVELTRVWLSQGSAQLLASDLLPRLTISAISPSCARVYFHVDIGGSLRVANFSVIRIAGPLVKLQPIVSLYHTATIGLCPVLTTLCNKIMQQPYVIKEALFQ